MKPLETLRNEHGLIRQFLDQLELAGQQLDAGERPPTEFFEMAVRFAREFADEYHHIKEEHILFVQLAQKHGGAIDGETESLRHQHETGRDHVAAIAGALDGYEEGSPIKTDQIREAIREYVPMLRDHTHTEDHHYFPMAEKLLSEEEHAGLQTAFDRARQKAGEEPFEFYHMMVVQMGSMLSHM
jgi:hemerythrin-like domain-containing protein